MIPKGGLNLNVVFPPLSMGLIEMSRSPFLTIQKLYAHPTTLCLRVFKEIFGFILEEIVFLKGLVKLGKIR